MPRIAIFAINYWPDATGAALNTIGIASGLARRGWDVTVVAGIPHYPSWRASPAPRSEEIDGVRVRRFAHYVPPTQSVVGRGTYELTWYVSALRALPSLGSPDVLLGVSPSLGGAALARTASAVLRVPYALLIQDLVGRAAGQSGIAGGALVAGPLGAIERWLAKDAAATMIVAEGFRDHFAGVSDGHIVRVRNPVRLGRPTIGRADARRSLGWRDEETVVLHAGAIGFKQDLERVLDAAALAGTDMRFVFQGEGSIKPGLERAATRRGMANVSFRPLDPEEALPNTLAAADVLLLHQRAGVRNMSLPAKLGTYFASGRPVVAAVDDRDEVAREVRASGGGVVVPPGDPAALVAAIRSMRADPARADELGRRGAAFAERELSPVAALDAIESILRSASRAVGSTDPSDHDRRRPTG